MNDLYDLSFHVENELTGVPEAVVKFTLRNTVREFCRRTHAWKLKTYSRIDKEVCAYSASGFADAEVLAVTGVFMRRAGEKEFANITRSGFYRLEGNFIFLQPEVLADNDGGEMVIESAVTPMFESANVPSDFLSRHSGAIISGAVAELAKQKNRPWYNPEAYEVYSARYRGLVNSAMPARNFHG